MRTQHMVRTLLTLTRHLLMVEHVELHIAPHTVGPESEDAWRVHINVHGFTMESVESSLDAALEHLLGQLVARVHAKAEEATRLLEDLS